MVIIMTLASSLDKIFVGKFLGEANLGIYSAYIMVTVTFIAQLSLVIDNVLFPMVNKVEKKESVMKKIDKMAALLFIPAVLFIFVFASFMLNLFGKAYTINYWFVLAFSLVGFLQLLSTTYRNVVISSHRAYRIFTKLSLLSPVLIVALFSFLYMKNILVLQNVIIAYVVYNIYYFLITRGSFELGKQ